MVFDYAVLILDLSISGCKMFDEKLSLESYFGSIGYDFGWETNRPQKDKIMRNMELYGYPHSSQGYELNQYLGDALIDKFCLLYIFNTRPGVSGAPVF